MLAPWHSASSPIAKGSGIKGRFTDPEAFRVSTNKENEKSGVKVTMLAFLMVPVIKDADKEGIMQPLPATSNGKWTAPTAIGRMRKLASLPIWCACTGVWPWTLHLVGMLPPPRSKKCLAISPPMPMWPDCAK
jgi:hypothetical protein